MTRRSAARPSKATARLALALGLWWIWAAQAAAAEVETFETLSALVKAQGKRIEELEARLRAGQATPWSSQPPAPPQHLAAAPPPLPPLPTAKVRGRLQADALLIHEGEGSTPTGTQLRRFYLGVEGRLSERTRFLAEADFAGGRVNLQEVLLAYRPTDRMELIVGHQQTPNSLDAVTSDLTLVFLERSAFATAFTPSKRVGASAHLWGERWGLRAGLFGETDDAAQDGVRSEAWSANARASTDLLAGDDALHVGVSAYYAEPGPTTPFRITQRPETNRAPAVLDTGAFAAGRGAFVGGEIGYGAGPLTVQAEGGFLDFAGATRTPRFHGYSAQAAWRLTGEPRPYDARSGVFGRVTPRRPIDAGGRGAFEVGLRASYVDLTDAAVAGGALTTYGVAINWYPLARVRLGANLIHARTATAARGDSEQTLMAVRAQADW